MKITEIKEGLVIEVFVKPRSKEFQVVMEEDRLLIRCREEPVRGKVNKELVKELSKLFYRDVALLSGFSSNQKRLLIKNISKNEAERILRTF